MAHHSYTNSEIAQHLTDIATAYEIKRKNFFRITSYQNAADTILTYPKSVYQLWKKDHQVLDRIPGIGPNISRKITYLFAYGQPHPQTVSAFKNIHPAVFTFTKINGIGPKIAHKLTKNLKFFQDPIKALNQLINYAETGKIRDIPTFGQKSENLILENTKNFMGLHHRLAYAQAHKIASGIITYLKNKFPEIEFISLGSLRRHSPSVGDIDLAAKSAIAKPILDFFVDYPFNIQTIVKGPKKASIRLKEDVRVDIMIQPEDSWGSLLQHFTGSKQHNILLRRHAQNLGFSLSEYGIKDLSTGRLHRFKDEKSVYNFLKLCYIEPENRLGESEIELAQKCYNNKNNY